MMSAAETRPRNELIDARLVAFLPRLRRFCHGLAGNADQGDDLLQAAFERALSRIDQWQVGTNLENWVFRLASNINIDGARARRVRGVPVDIDEAYDLSGDDEVDRLEQRSELDAVRAALARLPVELRDVMAAVVLEEKSYRETADMLDIPIGTVMSRMSRARQFIESHVHRNPDARRSA